MKEINKVLAREWVRQSALVVMVLAASVAQSQAQSYNLSTGDTSLQINVGGANPGLSDWMVGGVDELNQQWFYYSVGTNAVNSIDTISSPTFSQNGTTLGGSYSDSTLKVTTTYTLNNVFQNSSWLAELTSQVAVQNLSGIAQTFNFYQYSDFGIGGASGNQNVLFLQSGSFPYTVYQYSQSNPGIGYLEGSIDIGLGTTVIEDAGTATQFGLINGAAAPNLTDNYSSGPGNVDFAYEFTAILAPDASITFSEIQTVPEPSSAALISSGVLALGLFYKRGFKFLKNFKLKT